MSKGLSIRVQAAGPAVRALAMGIVFLVIGACGGGGGGGGGNDTSDFPAQGLYWGETDSGRAILGMVRDDGAYWMMYTDTSNSYVAGAVQGTAQAKDGVFTSTNAKDFSGEYGEIYDAQINADYTAGSGLSGTVSYDYSESVFSMAYDPDYELTPSLSQLTGYYYGGAISGGGNSYVYLDISSRGELSGYDDDDCTFSGTATPDPHGNLFNLSVKFHGGSCSLGTETVAGIAYYDGSRLYAVAVNGSRDNGFIFLSE